MKILFLAKNKPFAQDAAELLKLNCKDATIYFGERKDPFPEIPEKNDYVISYICPWIIPKNALVNTNVAAINFHPGPPEYPGIGCTNFALYNNAKVFGITVHHMDEKVDSGAIIAVERFHIFDNDTVYTLTQRCYAYIYIAFVKILELIVKGIPIPRANETWARKPYTRKDLNDLCVVNNDMSRDELNRRIKATTYPNMPGALLNLKGNKFLYNRHMRGTDE